MKVGLFLALLVLLAATNVYGQAKASKKDRPASTKNREREQDDVSNLKSEDRDRPDGKSDTHVKHTDDNEVESSDFDGKSRPTNGKNSNRDVDKTDRKDQESRNRSQGDKQRLPNDRVIDEDDEDMKGKNKQQNGKNENLREKSDRQRLPSDRVIDEDDEDMKGKNKQEKEGLREKGDRPRLPNDRVIDEDDEDIKGKHKKEQGMKEGLREKSELPPPGVGPRRPVKSVNVHGTIDLVGYSSSFLSTVEYDTPGAGPINNARSFFQPLFPGIRDFIAPESRITLYVSTYKEINKNKAFAHFPIPYKTDSFPLNFNLDIDLLDQQRGLLERADITLYFFVYITNAEGHIHTFIPAGISQVLFQGANRNIEPLRIFVRANGVEVSGLIRGRYGERFNPSRRTFQILIVNEKIVRRRVISPIDAVAQLTIRNPPSMLPVPFSLLVPYQRLRPGVKYYAFAYTIEDGIRELINYEPVLIINELSALVIPQLIFTIVPSPFILKGLITRSMPGSFFVQPGSSIGLNIREIGSNQPDIVFMIPDIARLPQKFLVNLTESSRFNPSKFYEVTAQLTDRHNNIYMLSPQPIPLVDDINKVIIPVDDYLYYVRAYLQPSTGDALTFIPGSKLKIVVTETPEAPEKASKPLVTMILDDITPDFRDFTLKIPTTGIQRNRDYYLVMMIESNKILTHVSKTLLISNNQRPPSLIQLPVLALNSIRGIITDADQRPARWSAGARATLYLIDTKIENVEKATIQTWNINLEKDFPIQYEVHLDFSRINLGRQYRLEATIDNGPGNLEYKPAKSSVAFNPALGILNDIRLSVLYVKKFQTVRGLINMNGVEGPLPKMSEIIIELSATPSIENPKIIEQFRIPVENRPLPVDFKIDLDLNKFGINDVYFFLVRYVVRDTVVIPVSQVFAFSPRNQVPVIITLSRSPQIAINGQITSTGGGLDLPPGATVRVYLTNNPRSPKPFIYSEVFLQSTPSSVYDFTLLVDSSILHKDTALYISADIIYRERVILRMPRPALVQLSSGSLWNINIVIDLPTLVVGEILSLTHDGKIKGDFDAYIQVISPATKQVVHVIRFNVGDKFSQQFRFELDNQLFLKYPELRLRALIKNCKEEILYESSNDVDVHFGINLNVKLAVRPKDIEKLSRIGPHLDETAPLDVGKWQVILSGVTGSNKRNDIAMGFFQK